MNAAHECELKKPAHAEGKIHLMRQYLDTGSVWIQFK